MGWSADRRLEMIRRRLNKRLLARPLPESAKRLNVEPETAPSVNLPEPEHLPGPVYRWVPNDGTESPE